MGKQAQTHGNRSETRRFKGEADEVRSTAMEKGGKDI